jgi:hypothetical protein
MAKATQPTCYYRVSTKGRVRFESVFQSEAEDFARGIYKKESNLPDIDEVDRTDRNQK